MFAFIYVLSTKEKQIISVNSLKKFNVEKHVPNQKYKFLNGNESKECIVLKLAGTRDELQGRKAQRERIPSAKVLQSAAESTDDEIGGHSSHAKLAKRKINEDPVLNHLNKRLREFDDNIETSRKVHPERQEQTLASTFKTSRPVLTDPLNIGIQPNKQNLICKDCVTTKEEILSLKENNSALMKELYSNNEELSDSRNKICSLQQEIDTKQNELNEIRVLNIEWQKASIINHKNLLAIQKVTIENPSASRGNGNIPPVGFVTDDESQIHIGRGFYLSMQAWYLALHVPNKRHITFAKNILVSLCGYDYLTKTTISGKGSNRNQQTKTPQEKLDPKILLAVRDIYGYYLQTQKNFTPEDADIEAGKVHTHISKKIASLKDEKKKAFSKRQAKEKELLGGGEAVISTDSAGASVSTNSNENEQLPVEKVAHSENSIENLSGINNSSADNIIVSDNGEQMLFFQVDEQNLIEASSDEESQEDSTFGENAEDIV